MKRLLVITLTTALIGSGGYFAWQQTRKDTSKSSPPPPTQSQPSPPASDPSERGKYLVIKEWGVRFGNDQIRGDQFTYMMSDAGSVIAFFDKSSDTIINGLSPEQLTKAKSCVAYTKVNAIIRTTIAKYQEEKESEYYLPVSEYGTIDGYVYQDSISSAQCPVLSGNNTDPSLKKLFDSSPFKDQVVKEAFMKSVQPSK